MDIKNTYLLVREFKICNQADFDEFFIYFQKKVQQFFKPVKFRKTPLRYKTLKIFDRGLSVEKFSLQSYKMVYNETDNSISIYKNDPRSTRHVKLCNVDKGITLGKRYKKGKNENYFFLNSPTEVQWLVTGEPRYTDEERQKLSNFVIDITTK